jgi:bifunctional DNA-binding transcriptional regulator/antitoxin component of YhaV-PrlF toxin-antitoxin module
MEALQVKPRPLEVKADQKSRLQIPVLVRRMIKAGPGARFNLFVTEEGDLYFSKTEK